MAQPAGFSFGPGPAAGALMVVVLPVRLARIVAAAEGGWLAFPLCLPGAGCPDGPRFMPVLGQEELRPDHATVPV